jgi:hypothetical protein
LPQQMKGYTKMEEILSLILTSKDPEKAVIRALECVKDFLGIHGANLQAEEISPQELEASN